MAKIAQVCAFASGSGPCGGQPGTIPSVALEGVGSGTRIVRNELNKTRSRAMDSTGVDGVHRQLVVGSHRRSRPRPGSWGARNGSAGSGRGARPATPSANWTSGRLFEAARAYGQQPTAACASRGRQASRGECVHLLPASESALPSNRRSLLASTAVLSPGREPGRRCRKRCLRTEICSFNSRARLDIYAGDALTATLDIRLGGD